MQEIESVRNIIEEAIEALKFENPPAELYHPISYTLKNKGKRIRPILTLVACKMFSEKIDNAIAPALGLEVFHNFTLLHDDIMDNAPVRRGNPTVHEKWNANTAILSGDAMMVEAYKLVSKAPAEKLSEALDLFSHTASGVCEGQMYDMLFEERSDVKESEYMEMIRLKTSVLLAASIKMGAIIGGASKTDADLLYDFGINLGLSFQLIDDWLDVYSDPKVFGKKNGGDIVENKKTFMLINALEKATGVEKQQLEAWISKSAFDEAEKIASVKEIYTKLNIDELTLNKAKEYSEKAFEQLDKVSVKTEQKIALESLGKYLLSRIK
ncbi:MAG: polyprenyl synthetase family protein [Salinivirgaceae bacterium]|nr:polyprenyl synthetase family protein [Salinivirgaceae bacterium]